MTDEPWFWLVLVDTTLFVASLGRLAWEMRSMRAIDRAFAAALAKRGVDVTIVGATERDVVIGPAEREGCWHATSTGFAIELEGRTMHVPEGVHVVYEHRTPTIVGGNLAIRGGTRVRALVQPDRVDAGAGTFRTADVIALDAMMILVPLDDALDHVAKQRLSLTRVAACTGVLGLFVLACALSGGGGATFLAAIATVAFVADHALYNVLVCLACERPA